MSDEIFATVEANQIQGKLLDMLCRTAREKGRVEITNCGGGDCVIISKEELASLERALEIFMDMEGAKKVCQHIRRYAFLTLSDGPSPEREIQFS